MKAGSAPMQKVAASRVDSARSRESSVSSFVLFRLRCLLVSGKEGELL
jgi:hypothetical protein